MPLFLKSIDPDLSIFGKRQALNFNEESATSENNAELFLINHFEASSTTSLFTALGF